MFCFHKYGEIKDGYQYCSKCNKARLIPCNHKWKVLSHGNITRRNPYSELRVIGDWYNLQCEKCGEVKREECLLSSSGS